MNHSIEAKIVFTPNDGKCVAIANITIDNDFVIGGVKLLEGQKGRFISMPQRKTSKGEYIDIAFPLDGKIRDQIFEAVDEAYHNHNEPVNSRGANRAYRR